MCAWSYVCQPCTHVAYRHFSLKWKRLPWMITHHYKNHLSPSDTFRTGSFTLTCWIPRSFLKNSKMLELKKTFRKTSILQIRKLRFKGSCSKKKSIWSLCSQEGSLTADCSRLTTSRLRAACEPFQDPWATDTASHPGRAIPQWPQRLSRPSTPRTGARLASRDPCLAWPRWASLWRLLLVIIWYLSCTSLS